MHGAERRLGVEHAARVDFVPVVILGVDPEDRHRRARRSSSRTRVGQPERGERLQEVKSGPPKRPGLLAGDDGDRSRVAQLRGGGAGGRRARRAGLLLRRAMRGQRVALAGMALRARDGVAPGVRVARVAGEERRQPAGVERVVGGEAIDPGKPADIDAQTRGRGGDACVRDAPDRTVSERRAQCQGRRMRRMRATIAG